MENKKLIGFKNEEMFANYLNNKKVKHLPPHYQEMIIELFGYVNFNSYLSCWVDRTKKKYDIVIKLDNKYRRVSIKMGVNNSVHTEGISNFIHFLIENNMPRDIVIKYLKYHYSDGTTNGKGTNRISAKEYKELHNDDIEEINFYFNKEEFIIKSIYRFVLKGTNSNISVDGLIHGTVDDFLFISKKDIIDILLSHKDNVQNGVHISDLFCQAKAKNLNYNPKYEKDRFCLQVKWFDILDCIIEKKYINECDKRELNSK